MTAKRFTLIDDYLIEYDGDYFDLHKPSDIRSLVNVIGYVTDENEQLKSEIKMLKTTIGRNEAYINQMKSKGEWR